MLYLQLPLGGTAIKVGADDLLAKTNVFGDLMFASGFLNVITDVATIGNAFFMRPGFEFITQSKHIRVGADARITKQVPGAADGVPTFQNGKGFIRAVFFKMTSGTNAG